MESSSFCVDVRDRVSTPNGGGVVLVVSAKGDTPQAPVGGVDVPGCCTGQWHPVFTTQVGDSQYHY